MSMHANPQHVCPLGQGELDEQPTVHVPPPQMWPEPQSESSVHSTQEPVASQRPAAPPERVHSAPVAAFPVSAQTGAPELQSSAPVRHSVVGAHVSPIEQATQAPVASHAMPLPHVLPAGIKSPSMHSRLSTSHVSGSRHGIRRARAVRVRLAAVEDTGVFGRARVRSRAGVSGRTRVGRGDATAVDAGSAGAAIRARAALDRRAAARAATGRARHTDESERQQSVDGECRRVLHDDRQLTCTNAARCVAPRVRAEQCSTPAELSERHEA